MTDADVRACTLRLVTERGWVGAQLSGKTICPSEVARALAADESGWRGLMPLVREVAAELAAEGLIQVTQRGQVVDARAAKGAIRLGLRTSWRDG